MKRVRVLCWSWSNIRRFKLSEFWWNKSCCQCQYHSYHNKISLYISPHHHHSPHVHNVYSIYWEFNKLHYVELMESFLITFHFIRLHEMLTYRKRKITFCWFFSISFLSLLRAHIRHSYISIQSSYFSFTLQFSDVQSRIDQKFIHTWCWIEEKKKKKSHKYLKLYFYILSRISQYMGDWNLHEFINFMFDIENYELWNKKKNFSIIRTN